VYTTTLEIGADSLGLSSKWTDNKDVARPDITIKRVVTPGIRQKNVIPKTVLKKTGVSIRKNANSPISSVKNKPKAQIKSAPTHQWVGTSGNLKQPIIKEKKMPAAVLQKLNH